ncbi:MAG: hypothetical protein MUF49_30700 [Oculatellaceae cyanobacterium Prado106]|nr:hypothetical protein [Oculatellaceae cyanobacterium Prado106]
MQTLILHYRKLQSEMRFFQLCLMLHRKPEQQKSDLMAIAAGSTVNALRLYE